jgi:phosphoribosyl-AMP cyclohydrolase
MSDDMTNDDVAGGAMPDFASGDGLLPAVAQDAATGRVLMVAWMNAESYAETRATGRAVYFSRSRGRLWRKGEESGHVQQVQDIYLDCDRDTILLKVTQVGDAACHEGYESCFYRRVTGDRLKGDRLKGDGPEGDGLEIVDRPLFDPDAVYGKKG